MSVQFVQESIDLAGRKSRAGNFAIGAISDLTFRDTDASECSFTAPFSRSFPDFVIASGRVIGILDLGAEMEG